LHFWHALFPSPCSSSSQQNPQHALAGHLKDSTAGGTFAPAKEDAQETRGEGNSRGRPANRTSGNGSLIIGLAPPHVTGVFLTCLLRRHTHSLRVGCVSKSVHLYVHLQITWTRLLNPFPLCTLYTHSLRPAASSSPSIKSWPAAAK
jgi:hypothetical protein